MKNRWKPSLDSPERSRTEIVDEKLRDSEHPAPMPFSLESIELLESVQSPLGEGGGLHGGHTQANAPATSVARQDRKEITKPAGTKPIGTKPIGTKPTRGKTGNNPAGPEEKEIKR